MQKDIKPKMTTLTGCISKTPAQRKHLLSSEICHSNRSRNSAYEVSIYPLVSLHLFTFFFNLMTAEKAIKHDRYNIAKRDE